MSYIITVQTNNGTRPFSFISRTFLSLETIRSHYESSLDGLSFPEEFTITYTNLLDYDQTNFDASAV